MHVVSHHSHYRPHDGVVDPLIGGNKLFSLCVRILVVAAINDDTASVDTHESVVLLRTRYQHKRSQSAKNEMLYIHNLIVLRGKDTKNHSIFDAYCVIKY